MVKPVECYIAVDGELFEDERSAHLHEIELKLRAHDNPRLKSSISVILEEADFLATILLPLAPVLTIPPSNPGRPPSQGGSGHRPISRPTR